ncbi:ATP synthase subunit I [Thermodesulfobacteriota bacterium]
MDEEIKKTQKQYCTNAMFYAIVAAFILIIIGEKTIGKGLILGTLFSVLNFIIMGVLIERQITHAGTKARAGAFSFLYMLMRFAVLSIPLIISYKVEALNFFGTVAGIFMVQFAILFDNLIVNRFLNTRKV